MRTALVLLAFSTACAGARPSEVAPRGAVVEVPRAESMEEDDTAPPARSAQAGPANPLDYYVGTWDGVFTDERRPSASWETVLTIDGYGRFKVRHDPPYGRPCENQGTLRVTRDVLFLDLKTNTCNPDLLGVQERPLVSKTEDQFIVRTPDSSVTYRYTRRHEISKE